MRWRMGPPIMWGLAFTLFAGVWSEGYAARDDSELQDIPTQVRAQREQLLACVHSTARSNGAVATGKLLLRFDVTRTGRVVRPNVTGTGSVMHLRPCLITAMKSMRFRPHAGSSPIAIEYPLVIQGVDAPGLGAVRLRRPGGWPSVSIDLDVDDPASGDGADRSVNGELVRGALDKEIIRGVVRKHLSEVRACYEWGLASNPTLRGRLVAEFIITPTGRVAAAVVQESSLAVPLVERCITKMIEEWEFPKPEGGGVVVVSYPFMFTPSEAPGGDAPRINLAKPAPGGRLRELRPKRTLQPE